MKWLITVGVLLAGGFVAYRSYDSSAGPVRKYEKFAEEILHRHYDVAAGMCDGLSKDDLEQSGTMEQIGSGPAMFQTLFNSRFEISARETAPDGTLTLTAVQTVLWNPPGVESVMRPAMFARMNQVVSLRKTGGDWKIVEFKNKLGSMDEFKARPQ